jgi:tRNA dimethylallyltransferase
MLLAPRAWQALFASASVNAGRAGCEIRVATRSFMDGSENHAGVEPLQNAVLIAGPTASGKSALALDLARRTGGVVVNADSMQVYSLLRIVTARPSDKDMAEAEHLLYGHVHPSVAYSVGHWQRDLGNLIASGALAGRQVIFAGGTGLYFKALTGGLAYIPDVDADVRQKWRALLAAAGPEQLHRTLSELDPDTALDLRPGDGQRIVRALEVWESTGASIRHWQSRPGIGLVDAATAVRIVVDPGREVTNRRVAERFEQMIDNGALEEVEALLGLGLDPALPAMRAIGVPELGAYLRDESTRIEAIKAATIATRQYAKRQRTWFRHQFGADWIRISGADPAETASLLVAATDISAGDDHARGRGETLQSYGR